MPASQRVLGVPSFSECGESPGLPYVATTVTQVFFIATVPVYVTQLTYRIRIASTSGTATFYKVPSGTAVGSGTAISGSTDLGSTPAADTTLDIPLLSAAVGNGPGVRLAAGDAIGVVIAGTMTNGVGLLQAFVEPVV